MEKINVKKMHIGKKHKNEDICVEFEVDTWEDKIVKDDEGNEELNDKHMWGM